MKDVQPRYHQVDFWEDGEGGGWREGWDVRVSG